MIRSGYWQIPRETNIFLFNKIAEQKDIKVPNTNVLSYLCDVVDKTNYSKNREFYSKYTANSIEEIEARCTVVQDQNPNSRIIVISEDVLSYAQDSGDNSLNSNALITNKKSRNYDFTAFCYSIANACCDEMGKKEEAKIFGLLALKVEKYVQLLANFYQFFKDVPPFKGSEKEFRKLIEKQTKKSRPYVKPGTEFIN